MGLLLLPLVIIVRCNLPALARLSKIALLKIGASIGHASFAIGDTFERMLKFILDHLLCRRREDTGEAGEAFVSEYALRGDGGHGVAA